MEELNTKPGNIEEYIDSFSPKIQLILEEMRTIIQEAAPGSTETISYGIPTFQLNRKLVQFAAFKNHIGFYPTPERIEEFEKELSVFKKGKGSVQFPINQPLPINLIKKIVKYQVKNDQKNTTKLK
jgi:uncharacterized protein YdhG (YjbR/CyaY superfamily)